MKRLVLGSVLVIALVLAVVPFASAQGGPAVTGKGGEDRSVGIQVYGDLDLQMRYMNGAYSYGVTGVTNNAQWLGSPKLDLYLSAALADKASVLVEIQVPRLIGGALQAFGPSPGEHYVTAHQAYLKLDQLITQDLTVTFGVQEVVFDIVGKGNPLVMALGRSERASATGGFAVGTSNAREEAEAGGLRLDYKIGAAGNVTVFHMITGNNFSVEGNEYVTGADLNYKVTDKTTAEGLIALINPASLPIGVAGFNAGKGSEVWLIGAGVASNGEFVPGLNLFAQAYFNFGTWYESGVNPGVASIKQKANGLMFDIGGDYTFDMAWKPCVGAEYLYVSGNKMSSTTPGTDDHKAFVSFEDNNDLVVIEDKEFGFDIDENYWAFKIRGSVSGDLFTSPVKDAFSVEALLGITRLVQDVGTVANHTDKLGTELDVKANWMANKQLKVFAGIGLLFGSDVLKDNPAVGKGTAFTLFTGTNVKF